MILAFSGDPFLVARAARRALSARGFRGEEVSEFGESLTAEALAQAASQVGLFGRSALLLDFGAAFQGQAGVKPRNDVLRALAQVSPEALVAVLDADATAPRQKTYKELGEHQHLPTPRFGALEHWIRQELNEAGVRFETGVPQVLADLFGEDLPAIASEIAKLAVLDEELSGDRVRAIVNRPAARDAFDLIEASAQGEAARALAVCRSLLAQGEAPQRVLGALAWQYHLVARAVGLQQGRARPEASLVAQTLKVSPFVAKKAFDLARKLDEPRLRAALKLLLEADIAMKTGHSEGLALESLALRLSGLFEKRKAGA